MLLAVCVACLVFLVFLSWLFLGCEDRGRSPSFSITFFGAIADLARGMAGQLFTSC